MIITYNGGQADKEVLAEGFTALRWTKQTDSVILDMLWKFIKDNQDLSYPALVAGLKQVYKGNTTRGRLSFSEGQASIDGEDRNYFEIIRRGVLPSVIIREGKDKPKEEAKANWYTPEEMRRYLKSQNYSDDIAEELCNTYADNLTLAFEKGKSKQRADLEKYFLDTPEYTAYFVEIDNPNIKHIWAVIPAFRTCSYNDIIGEIQRLQADKKVQIELFDSDEITEVCEKDQMTPYIIIRKKKAL